MPALNFKKQFADAVASGEKTQTIRARRKHPIKVGDVLYLYTGMRTQSCRAIGEAECISVETIAIYDYFEVAVGAELLTPKALLEIARADGFHGGREFVRFFEDTYGFPFIGTLIRWRLK